MEQWPKWSGWDATAATVADYIGQTRQIADRYFTWPLQPNVVRLIASFILIPLQRYLHNKREPWRNELQRIIK